MVIIYIFSFLLLNLILYKIIMSLKTIRLQIIFLFFLLLLSKLRSNVENGITQALIHLLCFSIAIPIFSLFFKTIVNYKKSTNEKMTEKNKRIKQKITNYLERNDYTFHFTVIITLYQFFMLLSGIYLKY
ncbi:hypothetical protein FLJU110815_17450 [Flavobacterium jumunjinense]